MAVLRIQSIVWLEPKNFAQFGNFYDLFGNVWAATGDTFSGPFHTNDYLNTFGDPVWLGFTTSLKGVKLYDKYSNAHLLEVLLRASLFHYLLMPLLSKMQHKLMEKYFRMVVIISRLICNSM